MPSIFFTAENAERAEKKSAKSVDNFLRREYSTGGTAVPVKFQFRKSVAIF
jgi:hypothetical protein